MTWLTWRQFRVSAGAMAAALVALAVILGVTGPGLADDYSAGIATCASESGGCADFVQRFFRDKRDAFLAVTALVLVVPALIGLFWGAPLISRELEAGTHRLVWNQSITRTRWLAVKLGLVGLATITAAGLATLVVSWWSSPIDKTAIGDFPRMEPLVFAARGIVPIGYAAFAFALGVTVGMLVRRTLPAMAITLAVFVAVQLAMPLLVRPHLASPVRTTIKVNDSNFAGIGLPGTGPIRVFLKTPETGAFTGAWVLSSHAVDPSGDAVDSITLPRPEACAVSSEQAPAPLSPTCTSEIKQLVSEVKQLGYRQEVTYQPSSRFWTLQALETAVFLGLAVLLSGFSLWWLRSRVS